MVVTSLQCLHCELEIWKLPSNLLNTLMVIFVCAVFLGGGFQWFDAFQSQQRDYLAVPVFLGTFWSSSQNSARGVKS